MPRSAFTIPKGEDDMTRVMKASFLQILILAWALPVSAQSPAFDIRASGEYRMTGGNAAETGSKLAFDTARTQRVAGCSQPAS